MAAAPRKQLVATPLAPRPTFSAANVPSQSTLRPLAPAVSSALPTPPVASVNPANGAPTAATAIPPSVPLPSPPAPPVPTPTASSDEKTAVAASGGGGQTTPGRRQFTWEDESHLVELWKRYINEYFNGVRKRVLEKMTDELNLKLPLPHFTVKQVNNKLHYMERRYRALLDDFRNAGTPAEDADVTVSVRASVERKFSLFYVVHDVLRDMVGSGAQTATPNAEANASLPELADVDEEMPTTPDDVGGEATTTNVGQKRGQDDSVAPAASSPKRQRSEAATAGRAAALVERMMGLAEKLVEADSVERKAKSEDASRAHEVRLRELELLEKQNALRMAETRATLHRQRIESLKYVVEHGEQAARERSLRALEGIGVNGEAAQE